jgi:hypothetical protein
MNIQYIKASLIKKLAKSHGKRVSKQFLVALDGYVEKKILLACETHNGGKVTLDEGIAQHLFVGGFKKIK